MNHRPLTVCIRKLVELVKNNSLYKVKNVGLKKNAGPGIMCWNVENAVDVQEGK
jgi:hypothetical protein